MGVFDNYRDEINSYFSEWIKINDKYSAWTIEDFPYNKGVDEETTNSHCWKCVTVNNCWFKNQDLKKTERFDYSSFTYNQLPISKRGLYHPNCHCKEKAINVPKINELTLIIEQGKINNFFEDKSGWFYSWGFKDKDKDTFLKLLKKLILDSYRSGNYEKEKHWQYGYQINLFINLEGVNEKRNKAYQLKTAFIIYPEGKLRCVTLIGGWK